MKALYGHPDAGTFWEQRCNGEEWPSVYTHPELQLVYVGWELLREKLIIEPETGLDLYLGCNQSKGTVVLGNGHKVTTVTYDTEQFLRSCTSK